MVDLNSNTCSFVVADNSIVYVTYVDLWDAHIPKR